MRTQLIVLFRSLQNLREPLHRFSIIFAKITDAKNVTRFPVMWHSVRDPF